MPTKKVLVVDDSSTTRMLISLVLKKKNAYSIVEAEDGKEAVAKLEAEPFDIVLTDLKMPHMDGLELIAHIRATRSQRDIPIVVITTKGEEGDRERGLALGANAYIAKPISAPELVGQVDKLLGKAG